MMRKSSGDDLELLQDEPPYLPAALSKGFPDESEYVRAVPSCTEFSDLTLGEPQRVREGRDGYFVYPLLLKSQVTSYHRYKEFVWLRNELNAHFPACSTPALPDKEGVIGYWTSQDALFFTFRRYGLERFIQRVAAHPKLSKSPDFASFIMDDEINFHLRMKKAESNKGWYGKISDWGSSIAGLVSGYVSPEAALASDDGDYEFANHRNEIRALYQQQENLCLQGRGLLTSEESEISSNLALSKAYDNMNKVEKEGLAEKLKVLAETHASISEAHRSSIEKLKELVGEEMEDFRRTTLGLLEALERRQKIRMDKNLMASFDMKEINADLKKEILRYNQEKNFLSQIVSQKLILYKQDLSEKVAEIWRDAYSRVLS
jgi:sorting nexin-1/2